MKSPSFRKEVDRNYGKYTHMSDTGTIFSSSDIDSLLLDNNDTSEGGDNSYDEVLENFITENGTIFSSSLISAHSHRKKHAQEDKQSFSRFNDSFYERNKSSCSHLMGGKFIDNDGSIFSSSFDLTFDHLDKSYDNFSFKDKNYGVPNDEDFFSIFDQCVSSSDDYNKKSHMRIPSGRRSFRRDRRVVKVKNRALKGQADQIALLPNKISFLDTQTEPSALSKSWTFPHHIKLSRCVKFCAYSDCGGIKVKATDKKPTVPKLIRVRSIDRSSEIGRFHLSEDEQQSLMSEGTIQPQYWKDRAMWEEDCNKVIENSPKISRSPWNCKLWRDNSYEKQSNIEKSDTRYFKSTENEEGDGKDSETYFYKVCESSLKSNSLMMSSEEEYDIDEATHLDGGIDREKDIEQRKKRLSRRCFLRMSSQPWIVESSEKHLAEDNEEDYERDDEEGRDVLAELFWPDGIENSYEDFFMSLFCPENNYSQKGQLAKDCESDSYVDTLQQKSQKIEKDQTQRSKVNADFDEHRTNCVNSLCIKKKDAYNENKVRSRTESNPAYQQGNHCIGGHQTMTSRSAHRSTSKNTEFWNAAQDRRQEKESNSNDGNICEALMESLATKFYTEENLFLQKLEEVFLGPDEDSSKLRL